MADKRKPGPAPREGGPIKRRSISMSDEHWAYIEKAAKTNARSVSSMVCEWVDQRRRADDWKASHFDTALETAAFCTRDSGDEQPEH